MSTALSRRASNSGPPREDESKNISFGQSYAYRSLDLVTGTIHHAGIDADRMKVRLRGHIFISRQRFVDHQYRNVEKTWEFLKLTQRLALGPDAGDETAFSMRLPEALLETQCPLRNPFHLLIPPSIGCARADGLNDLTAKDTNFGRIQYQIVVEFVKDEQLVHTMNKSFGASPRHFASPGTVNPPPGYDESLTREADVQRGIGGKIGTFKTVLQQPPALLTSLEEHQLTTSVRLKLIYSSTSLGPPKINSISIKLLAHTHTRLDHLLEQGDDHVHHAELRLNKLDFRKPHLPVWQPQTPAVWATDLDLPVTLCPKGFVAVPEFNSCLMDRAYELMLKFDLSPQSGLPLSETRLKIPVWIMADEHFEPTSHSKDGQPKHPRRFQPPDDIQTDSQGTLPIYEDNYLVNLAGTDAPAIVLGDGGVAPAPFSLQGREPGYYDRSYRPRRGEGAQSGTIEGVDPTDEQEEDEANRTPSWQVKEAEQQRAADASPGPGPGAAQ